MRFTYMVKTEKCHDHFTTMAHGTKKRMQEWAVTFDAMPMTTMSRIVRDDGTVIHEYRREP